MIVPGETLSDIARQYMVSEETIKLTNSKIKFATDGNLDSLIGFKLLIPKEL